MRALITAIFVLSIVIACSKNESRNPYEHELFGKWQMGPGNGDTIEFLSSGGRNILRYYDAHFITGIYMEREFRYVDGKLSIQMYPAEPFTPITSFAWRQINSSFSVMTNQLYPLLSTNMTLIYNRIP
jgi:hypothetical protein